MTLYALLAEVEDATRICEGDELPASRARRSLEEMVLARLREYAMSLQGHAARDMYQLIMPQLERPLVQVAMELAKGRQNQAAEMLGIHRNTLRTRLKELGLDDAGNVAGKRRSRRR